MAERCDDCGSFQQRTRTADGGSDWLCLNCATDPLFDAIVAIRDRLGLNKRDERDASTCAFAFGIAAELAGEQLLVGRAPSAAAAKCIYLGSILAGNDLRQADVAAAADTSTAALRGSGNAQHYRDLFEASGFADHYGTIRQGELIAQTDPDDINESIDLDGWREHLSDRGFERSSMKAAVSNVRRFAAWYGGDGPPGAEAIEGWLSHLAEQGYAPSTIEGRWGSIRQYAEWAGVDGLDPDDVNLSEYVSRAWAKKVG